MPAKSQRTTDSKLNNAEEANDVSPTDTTEDSGNESYDPQSPANTQDQAENMDTTTMDTVAGESSEAPDAQADVARLSAFLQSNFPKEIPAGMGNSDAIGVAMRLLQGLVARADGTKVERCEAPYCNKASGHEDEHGWVNYAPEELTA